MAYIADRVEGPAEGDVDRRAVCLPDPAGGEPLPDPGRAGRVAPDHMVLHQGGPAGVVNTKALTYSGITRDTPDPPAGRIVKDPQTGEPTGMLRNAYSVLKGLPERRLRRRRHARRRRGSRTLFARYNARGLTSIADRGASVAGAPALSRACATAAS